jgi:hypothetical protein
MRGLFAEPLFMAVRRLLMGTSASQSRMQALVAARSKQLFGPSLSSSPNQRRALRRHRAFQRDVKVPFDLLRCSAVRRPRNLRVFLFFCFSLM